jgi:aminopeptidase N
MMVAAWRRWPVQAALLLSLLALLSQPAAAQPRFSFATAPGLLSKDVVPSHYALTLDLDPQRDGFSGQATITVRVHQPVAAIVLHAHELQSLASRLVGADGTTRTLAITPEPKTQTWRLTPLDARPIGVGQHRLQFSYVGKVQGSGEALYRAEHRNERGEPVRMLATQLESVFARKVFPAFDEPAFRAVFEIAVRAPKGLSVVSNMPLADRVDDGAAELHRFQPTPTMPTYLVAVSVGRYDELTGESAGVPLRILSAPGKRELSRYAMEVTRQVLPLYTEYFGLPYTLPKLDQLAVPAGRDGAMEDWGLISYAESVLLYDPAKSSPETKQTVFAMVAHEVAHQWFGNLVTASSWDEIWLNEAFATWLERKATARFNPDWQVGLQQRLPIDRTMTRDAGPATRAIRSGPVRESSVFDVFDSITYVKGGAVLSMLEQWIGEDAFRRGLAAYIAERKFSNATAGDLWYHLSAASGRDVSAVAASWTDQPGFPVVHLRSACEGGRTRVMLEQRRFANLARPPEPSLWKIPVRLARGGDAALVMLDGARAETELPGCSDEPVRANAGGRGFYRVAYEARALRALAARFGALEPADQVALLADSFALAQAGRQPMASWFDLLAAVPGVQGPARATLFTMAGAALEQLDHAVAGTPAQAPVRAAGRALFAPELARIGWAAQPQDDPQAEKLRGTLIARLAQWDDADTIAQARQRFAQDEAGQVALAPSIRAAVIEAVGTHADRSAFDQLVARLKNATSEEDRWLYAYALASGRDAGRARELLAASLTGMAPPNIAAAIPGMVGERTPLGAMAYDFTLANWGRLVALAGGNWGGGSWLLPNAASRFTDRARAARLVADQQRKAGRDGAVPAARVSASIELLAAVREREARSLARLLATWRPGG